MPDNDVFQIESIRPGMSREAVSKAAGAIGRVLTEMRTGVVAQPEPPPAETKAAKLARLKAELEAAEKE